MMRLPWLGCVVALTMATSHRAPAQAETVVVEQRLILTDQLTPAAVKRRALDEAMAEAVRRVVGVRVRSTAISTTAEGPSGVTSDYRSVVQLDAAGRATDVRVLREGWETADGAVRYHATWAITVAREVGVADPGFALDLTLPARTLRAPHTDVRRNEELIATVTSSRPAALLLATIVDDSVTVLLPNAWTGPVNLPATTATELPEPTWRSRGLRLRVTRPPGDAPRDALLVAVATTGDTLPTFVGGGLLAFQRWLVGIPLDRRAIAFAPYTVTP
jgi:hypothetical protein